MIFWLRPIADADTIQQVYGRSALVVIEGTIWLNL